MLVTLLIAVLIFCLLWWLISILPLPAPRAQWEKMLCEILAIATIIYLLKFI